jgi:hypothetical protein
MRESILFIALTLAVTQAAAEPKTRLTGSKGTTLSYESFIKAVNALGQDNYIRPNVAPLLALPPNAPTKAFLIDEMDSKSPSEPGKTCNVLVGDLSTNSNVGHAIYVDGHVDKTDLIARYFKADRDGKLLLAVHTVIKRDDNKQPIRGSGKATPLDVTSPAVQRDFKKELDFWLSGKYKKYLKAKSPAKEPADGAALRGR